MWQISPCAHRNNGSIVVLPLLRVLQLHYMVLANWYSDQISITVRLAVQPAAKQQSTRWDDYQCNTWLWDPNRRAGGITCGSLLVSTLCAMTCHTGGKEREKTTRKLHVLYERSEQRTFCCVVLQKSGRQSLLPHGSQSQVFASDLKCLTV